MLEQPQPSQSTFSIVPTEVWQDLSSDLKMEVIWLLSKLAFNFTNAQSESKKEEVYDATLSS